MNPWFILPLSPTPWPWPRRSFWFLGLRSKAPCQNPAPSPQPISLNPKTPTSPEKLLNNQLLVLIFPSLQDLQQALQPDLWTWGRHVTYVNTECQEVNSAKALGKGHRPGFAVPYNPCFPGLCNQALLASGVPMQCPSCPLDSSRSYKL